MQQAGNALRRSLGVPIVVLCVLVFAVGPALARPLPNHHQMTALYVIDHNGANPRSDAALLVYSRPFQKILASCRTNADDLTDNVLALADKASSLGGRYVTSLDMLRAIARRIAWTNEHKGCGYIYNLAEAYQEAGHP